jgi:cbb3-type cytochrome oxidase maturation protein
MEALYLLVPFSVVVVFFSIWLFLNMSDSGQFDDMVGPALRIVQDDDTLVDKPVAAPGTAGGLIPASCSSSAGQGTA